MMRSLKRAAAAAVPSSAGVVAALGPAAGAAHAGDPGDGEGPIDAWSNYEWCPGDPIPESDAPLTWDMNVCHIWHYQSIRDGAPNLDHIIEGRQESQCPPFAYMCP